MFARPLAPLMYLLVLFASIDAQIPDAFKNLQLLDPNLTKGQLLGTMKGFTRALGVRCLYCHVGTDGDRFTDVVFDADDKEAKRIARVMIEMTRSINATLREKTGRDPAGLTTVTCLTCHSGATKPHDLLTDLKAAYETDGATGALSLYAELREKYYGRAVYDFAPQRLTNLAKSIDRHGDTDGAIEILIANQKYFPKAYHTLFILSQVYSRSGNKKAAIKTAKKALKLDPGNQWYKDNLERIKGG